MKREVTIRGQRLRLEPQQLLGQGGEAEVFDIRQFFPGQAPWALKLWKPPDHPDFEGADDDSKRNREAAKIRLVEYAKKLTAFPANLPARVITPEEIAREKSSQQTAGYAMRLLDGAQELRQFTSKSVRQKSGVDVAAVVRIFTDLHRTVSALHARKVVIGDFNYLNVLVRNEDAYIIDADSMQFAGFMCRSFTSRFVDPLICNANETKLVQCRPHSELTDWYAYALMLFEALMFVHPYGGVYEPKDPAHQLPPDSRPLKRISVFNKEVIYPAKAVKLSWLPGRVADFYGEMLAKGKDARREFPEELLQILTAHAAGQYVDPAKAVPHVLKKEIIRGQVSSRRVFSIPTGTIVHAVARQGKLEILYHHDNAFKREDHETVLAGGLSPALKYRLFGRKTLIAMGSTLAVFAPGQTPEQIAVEQFQGRRPIFDTNARHSYWLSQGELWRDDALAPKFIGSVLSQQTLFWVGPTFGFGFYRAGGLTTGFVFDAERTGINDSVKLPAIRGQLIDAACVFSSHRAWFFTSTAENSVITNRCMTISPTGKVSLAAQAADGDGSWLGSIRGKCAATVADKNGGTCHRLFAATERGVVALDDVSGSIVERLRYADTQGLVEEDARLQYCPAPATGGSAGLYVVDDREVRLVLLP